MQLTFSFSFHHSAENSIIGKGKFFHCGNLETTDVNCEVLPASCGENYSNTFSVL